MSQQHRKEKERNYIGDCCRINGKHKFCVYKKCVLLRLAAQKVWIVE